VNSVIILFGLFILAMVIIVWGSLNHKQYLWPLRITSKVIIVFRRFHSYTNNRASVQRSVFCAEHIVQCVSTPGQSGYPCVSAVFRSTCQPCHTILNVHPIEYIYAARSSEYRDVFSRLLTCQSAAVITIHVKKLSKKV
jgi:hypothetical protein